MQKWITQQQQQQHNNNNNNNNNNNFFINDIAILYWLLNKNTYLMLQSR